MPQPAAQQQGGHAGAAVAIGGAVAAVGGAQAGAQTAQTAGDAVKVASATIMATFIAWLAALRAQHERWLRDRLGAYSTSPDDISQVVADEMARELEFARRSADRVASALPQALSISDDRDRQAAVRQVFADEDRYAAQRAEAMIARAISALTRMALRRDSPMGAFWRLGIAHRHTNGCKIMANRFWPWSVLDRVHPPRHYGCTSSLHGYGEAILAGWMTPSDVQDERAAIRAATGVMMEGEADALLTELDVRDQLAEQGIDTSSITFAGVHESFNPLEHRDFRGRWMTGGVAAAALKRGEPAAIEAKDAPKLITALGDGAASSLHLLQVGEHPNLFRSHARELSRGQMPQIPKEHLAGFMDFLRSKRVMGSVERVAPSSLQATQNQINGAAVAAIAQGWDPQHGGMMLASREGHVLDGHHRWAAASLHEMTNPGYKMQTLRFSAGTDRMLALMHEYNVQVGVHARKFGEGRVPRAAA